MVRGQTQPTTDAYADYAAAGAPTPASVDIDLTIPVVRIHPHQPLPDCDRQPG